MMNFEIDMGFVTESGHSLGFFEGLIDFKNIPTEGEKSILFDDKSGVLLPELREYVNQQQILEHLILFEQPSNNKAIGLCLFSFFYIPSVTYKSTFVDYFTQQYGLYFNDFDDI